MNISIIGMSNMAPLFIAGIVISGTLVFSEPRMVDDKPVTTAIQNCKTLRNAIGGGGIINAGNDGQHRLWASACQLLVENGQDETFRLHSGFWIPTDASVVKGAIAITSLSGATTFNVNTPGTITWQSNEYVMSVTILLSRNGGISWDTIFHNISGGTSPSWTAGLPRSDSCRLKIYSEQDERVSFTSDIFRIVPERLNGITKGSLQPGGSVQNAYRLISVPIRLDNPSPSNVLVDDLGSYDQSKWRFFDYQNGDYREFGDTRDFSPGRSFFLIVKKNDINIDADGGEQVADSVVDVPLTGGWNFIADPFNFHIPVTSLSRRDELHSYSDIGWSPVDSSDSLEPWEGYALWVDSAETLEIRLPGHAPNLAKTRELSETEWHIRIGAQCQQSIDLENYAGVRQGASMQWDGYDHLKPPPIGDGVRLFFNHEDWRRRPNIYGSDFRPEAESNHRWDFEVRNTIDDSASLRFDRFDEIPTESDVWLLDKIIRRVQNIRENSRYAFGAPKKGRTSEFALLVGDGSWVRHELHEGLAIPATFNLSQNYPNPFNAVTAIRYALPERRKVTLKVFDMHGREVRTLIDGAVMDAGFRVVHWDGKNRNERPAANGIYQCRLRAGNAVKTIRLSLIK